MHVERAELELETLIARLDRRELDPPADPPSGGWDRARQQRFVDTVLRQWCVPEIHVADGGDRDVVLDGGQRLLALALFFHDELPCAGEQAPRRDEVARLDGLCFSDLPGDVRRRVRRFRIPVVLLSDYEPAELRELLDRLHPTDEPAVPVPSPRAPEPPPDTRPSGSHRAPASPEPIYDQVSAWFADLSEYRDVSSWRADGAPGWTSPADEGRAAAEVVAQVADGPDPDVLAGTTPAGLPRREPRALLVPGAVPPPPAAPSTFGESRGTAAAVGERLASYRDGVAEGGDGARPTGADDPHPLFDDGAGSAVPSSRP
ncbi:DUF262 domain-containing protein [Actinomycetospora straminea]|uniref:DUF262 domain-containing protein n=1 Tax=Actinomycetospora straminea TaxID=663607 RepID=A0ABP9EH30_9PSEU|nr:DUF262 domain-containing protein [Actinomycetospora straminea]MDD7935626.1 DUF262 domain-containing protein [Actinomycetospora straminea]